MTYGFHNCIQMWTTNLNGRRVVTSHEGWSRRTTLVELPITPKEKRVVSLQGATKSLIETAELICISPDGRLDESLRYTSAGGEETMMIRLGDTLRMFEECSKLISSQHCCLEAGVLLHL